MKKLSFIFLSAYSNLLYAQIDDIVDTAVDSTYVEYYETAEEAANVAALKAANDASDYTSDGAYKIPDQDLDKFNFEKGKPVFIVVNIQHSIPNDSLLAVREVKELEKNFRQLNAKFVIIHKNAVLNFKNRNEDEYRFDDYNTQYQSVIFWDGKTDSDVYQLETIIQSSEAYSPQLGTNKNSSYVDEFLDKKEKLNDFRTDQITPKSVEVSKKYISNMFLAEVYYLKNEENFFPIDFKGVKKLTVKSNYKKFKNPVNEAVFDQKGNPVHLVLQSDDSDGKKIDIVFAYENEVLKFMNSSFKDSEGEYVDTEEFFYQDGNLYEPISYEGSFSRHYINENGFLLSHSYLFDDYRFFIMEDELTFKGKTLSYRDFGNLNNFEYTLNNLENFFPIKAKYRDGETYEIKKISSKEFQMKDEYSSTKIHLNDKGLISKVIMENLELEGESKPMDLIFEYFYEYY
mgnify:CR=1 FL=1